MTDSDLIAYYGGPAKLARLLGFSQVGGVQRVQNWVRRGIPPAVKVRFPELLLNSAIEPAFFSQAQAAIKTEALQQAQGVTHE